MTTGGVEAVGDGTVTAQMSEPPDCEVLLILNGSARNSVQVNDGDSISVELQTLGDCECCETKRDCNGGSQASMWMKKGNRENKTIVLNKMALEQRVKLIVEKVKKRSRGLRRNN